MNWQGKWIWASDDKGINNFRWCARGRFDLAPGFSDATLHISADSRYALWVNGRYVGFGPVRAFTKRWRYDTYDLTPYVHEGANVIAVLAEHYGVSTFQYLHADAGLIAQVECGGRVILATDANWRGASHPAYERRAARIAAQQPWSEIFDARRDPIGWTTTEFDDSQWTPAVVVDLDRELLARDIPFLTQEAIYPKRILGARTVREVRLSHSFGVKPYLMPGDLTDNLLLAQGVAATVLQCPEAMAVSFRGVHIGFCRLYIDGAEVGHDEAAKGVELAAGDHLIVADLWKRINHDWYVQIVIDSEGMPTLRSPLGSGEAYPYVLVGPFGTKEDAGFVDVTTATTAEQIAKNPLAKRIAIEDTCDAEVYCLTTFATDTKGSPTIEDPEAMFADNPDVTTFRPSPNGDTEIMLDFGQLISGYLEMEIDAPAGAIIDFNGIENIQEGRIQWTEGLKNTFRYIGRGEWHSWRSIVRRGFRYGTLTVRSSGPVRIRVMRCNLCTYPYADNGSFECSDARINNACKISRATIRMCSEDTFVDCPAYEQTFWVGDARNESLFAYAAFGDYQLARRCLLLAGESIERSPLVESHVPSGWVNVLPAWSLLWTIACEEHYQFTGDLDFLKEVYPRIALQNRNIRERYTDGAGLFDIAAWNMLDWAGMDTPSAGVVTHQNMWQVEALRRSVRIAELVGEPKDAIAYIQWAEELKTAINNHLWDDEKKAYIDSIHVDGVRSKTFSQQTQTVAFLCDIVPDEYKAAFEGYLTEVPDGWVKVGSPFMLAFNLEALDILGDAKRVLDVIRRYWGIMLDNDATTCWETLPEALREEWHTRSYCHAWSSAPVYALPTTILGVKPIEPGFAKFSVDPKLADLAWVKAIVPTPHGGIGIVARQAAGKIDLTIAVPPGTMALVRGTEYGPGEHTMNL